MSGERDTHKDKVAADTIKRLAEYADISEAEAARLISRIGLHWTALVREARMLKPGR